MSLAQRSLVFWTRLATHCAAELRRDKAPQVAAALAYHTLFSLIPILVLGFLIFQSVRGLEVYSDRFETLVIDVLLPETLLDSGEASRQQPSVAQAEFEQARTAMRERFTGFLRRIAELNVAGVGAVGILIFLYGAIRLLTTVENAFDRIYRAERRRPLRRRLPLYFTTMTLGPIALVAGQVAQDRLLERLVSTQMTAWLVAPLATLTPLLASWIVVFAIFRAMPNTRVDWRAAASGALVSALSWLTLQELFGIYVGSTIITSLYGALALIPILLLWVYLSWLVMLFGLEISYSLQHLGESTLPAESFEIPTPGDPRWLLPILATVGQRFLDGHSTRLQDLTRECGLPKEALLRFLATLESNGLIHAVAGKQGDRTYTMATPPSRIAIQQVLELAPLPTHHPGPAWDFLERLRSREALEAADGTLETLLQG